MKKDWPTIIGGIIGQLFVIWLYIWAFNSWNHDFVIGLVLVLILNEVRVITLKK